MKLQYILPVILAILSCACSTPERELLNQADSVIIDRPDSAMDILIAIDRNRLKGDDLPYYALLYTQAQLETGTRVWSDSLIRIAYEKYCGDTRGDKGIRSNFYLGEVNFLPSQSNDIRIMLKGTEQSKVEIDKALKYYLKAYEEAKRQGNDYWHARAAKRIKLNFCWIDNFYEGERYAREVVEHFKKAGRERDHRIAIIDHAQLYEPLEKFDLEREELDSLRSVLLQEEPADSVLLKRIDYELWHMGRAMDRIRKDGTVILSEDETKDLIGLSPEEILRKMIERGWTGIKFSYKYKRDLPMEITEARREYYDEVTRQNSENAATFQKLLWLAVLVFLTVIAILCWMFYFRYKAQKARMSTNLESFLSLKADTDRMAEEIEEHSDTISRLKLQLEEKSRQDSSRDEIVRNLLKEKWSTLGMLCDQLFDVGQSDSERKRVVRNIEKELKKVVSPQGVAETVRAVDTHMGGIVSRLMEQCPFLKENDINFLGLIYAGFSVRAVCMFTGMEYQHFYVKKSRLMKRIQNSDAPDRELFVECMQRK